MYSEVMRTMPSTRETLHRYELKRRRHCPAFALLFRLPGIPFPRLLFHRTGSFYPLSLSSNATSERPPLTTYKVACISLKSVFLPLHFYDLQSLADSLLTVVPCQANKRFIRRGRPCLYLLPCPQSPDTVAQDLNTYWAGERIQVVYYGTLTAKSATIDIFGVKF